MRVLIIEDEPAFVEALEVALTAEGLVVDVALDGRRGIELFEARPPAAVLLDLMLPEVPGLDVLRAIRRHSDVPVIVVSAKDGEADIVTALELGADDYLTKPYSVRELMARIRAVARRSTRAEEGDALVVGEAELHLDSLKLRLADHEQDLPKKEFEVLRLLMEQPGRVVPRGELLDEVWGLGWHGDTRTLDQHIRRLRRRLDADPGAPRIETGRGVGYRLVG